ncbi:hypothetical protein MUK42_09177 [Musa troglodytarum]|uniref:Uncharacterized protein n=1 Tax=Musa troglodytarum TaxID=320322 RepID=A0A9E7FIT7_9LILI|nr:hypothetical protein MUK42_09177 [Musa troglodytarum]
MGYAGSRRRGGFVGLICFASVFFWLLASQSICDGRVLNRSIDPSLWIVLLLKQPPSSGPSGCSTPSGMKTCDPPLGVSNPKRQPPATVAESTPP